VKKKHTDTDYVFVKGVKVGKDGVYTVNINPEDTEECDCCRYYYDVAVQSGENFYNVIEASVFDICKNITCWGCAGT
jgi:hypothetical protein